MPLPHQRELTEEAATTAIDQACCVLRVSTIRSQFPDLAAAASREQMSDRGFLAELLMSERDDRVRRPSPTPVRATDRGRRLPLR